MGLSWDDGEINDGVEDAAADAARAAGPSEITITMTNDAYRLSK
jgi:hypothetical protein